MTRFYLIILFLFVATTTFAQPPTGFRIEGRIRGLRDTTITLAHYFGYNQYIPKDTARIDSSGRFVFEGKKALPGGLYIVIPPTKKQQYIEFALGTSTFSFETDTASYTGNMRVTGSPDNELFYAYQKRMKVLTDEAQGIEMLARLRNDELSKVNTRRQLAELQKRAAATQKEFTTNSDSLLTVKLLRAMTDVDVPAAPRLKNGKIDSTFQYRYYKDHYWDTFDFSDERLVRTPIFQRKIDRYLREMTAPTVDSLIVAADLIVAKARASNEVLSYAIWYITSQYERPRIMGTDGLFVHMAETYYLAGVMPNTDPATVDNIRKRVETIKPLLIGKPFPALTVSDTLRTPIDLATIKAEYTVLFFYDPTCAHCRESMPGLKQFATDKVQSKDVQMCAISVDNSPDAWLKFIREYGIQSWVNGYDFSFRTNYRTQFDVLKTPTVYVLDKDKRIIARALPAEKVADFIQFQRGVNKEIAVRK